MTFFVQVAFFINKLQWRVSKKLPQDGEEENLGISFS